MPAAADTVKEVSPVWVFVVLDTHFDRLEKLVSERRQELRLFSSINNEGRCLDDQLVERLLDGASVSSPACYSNPTHKAFRAEAGMFKEPDPYYRSARSPPPQEQLAPVYGLNVDSLLALLLYYAAAPLVT